MVGPLTVRGRFLAVDFGAYPVLVDPTTGQVEKAPLPPKAGDGEALWIYGFRIMVNEEELVCDVHHHPPLWRTKPEKN